MRWEKLIVLGCIIVFVVMLAFDKGFASEGKILSHVEMKSLSGGTIFTPPPEGIGTKCTGTRSCSGWCRYSAIGGLRCWICFQALTLHVCATTGSCNDDCYYTHDVICNTKRNCGICLLMENEAIECDDCTGGLTGTCTIKECVP